MVTQLGTERAHEVHSRSVEAHAELKALTAAFARLKAAYRRDPSPSYEQRIAWLDALLQMVRKHRKRIADAISADFGHRSYHETQAAEIFTLALGLQHAKKHLHGWMQAESRSVVLAMKPGRAEVLYQPLGVVGVIAPWNYPF